MSPGEDEALCANGLSIAMSVIGLREQYENLSAQKRACSVVLPWVYDDAERQERGYTFVIHSSKGVGGIPSRGELLSGVNPCFN